MTKKQIINLTEIIAVGSVTAAGFLIGGPIGASVMAGIGINLATNIVKSGASKLKEHWLTNTKGILNHDIQNALLYGYLKALAHLQKEYLKLYDSLQENEKESKGAINFFFKELTKQAKKVFLPSLQKAINQQEVKDYLYNDTELAIGLLWDSIGANKLLITYNQHFINFLRENLLKEVQFYFAEELRTDNKESNKAWRAFQIMLSEGIQAEVQAVHASQDVIHHDLQLLHIVKQQVDQLQNTLDRRIPNEPFQQGLENAIHQMQSILSVISITTMHTNQKVAESSDDIKYILNEVIKIRDFISINSGAVSFKNPILTDDISHSKNAEIIEALGISKEEALIDLGDTIAKASSYFDSGRYSEAADSYFSIVSLYPNAMPIKMRLAWSYYHIDKLKEAAVTCDRCLEQNPNHSRAYNLRGIIFYTQKQLNFAKDAFLKAIENDDNWHDPHYHLALVYEDLGDRNTAIFYCYNAIKINPDCFEAHANLALLLEKIENFEEAEIHHNAALNIKPLNPSEHYNFGNFLTQRGRKIEAIKAYRTAIQLDPNSIRFYLNLGNILRDNGDRLAAIATYEDALQIEPGIEDVTCNLGIELCKNSKFKEAIEVYQRALIIHPKSAGLHCNLGNALADIGQIEQAISEYRLSISLNPQLIQPHLNLGVELAKQGIYTDAEQEFFAAISLNPKDAVAAYFIGNTLRDQKRSADAIQFYRLAASLDPVSPPVLNNLAIALIECNELKEAEEVLVNLIKAYPNDDFGHCNLGWLYFLSNRLEEAMQEIQIAVKINPDLIQAWANLSFIARKTGVFEEVIRACRAIIGIRPNDAAAHADLGTALAQYGDKEEGILELEKAVNIDPSLFGIYFNLGLALSAKGRSADAINAFRKAIYLKPDSFDFQKNLADELFHAGLLDEAKYSYMRAIEIRLDDLWSHQHLAGIFAAEHKEKEAVKYWINLFRKNPQNLIVQNGLEASLHAIGKRDSEIRNIIVSLQNVGGV